MSAMSLTGAVRRVRPTRVPADVRFIRTCYRALLARPADARGLAGSLLRLQTRGSRPQLVLDMVRSPEYVHLQLDRSADLLALSDDEEFLNAAYQRLLGRPTDPSGLRHYGGLLAARAERTDVLRALVGSDEHVSPAAAALLQLPDLLAEAPGRFRELTNDAGEPVRVYHADSPADFDWLERAIIDNGYYERPNIWGNEVDLDKRVVAEMIAALGGETALEIGCATGAVLECLADLGMLAQGLDISELARAGARDDIRPRIHLGDLLTVTLPHPYDVVYGMDVFEHLNPNRLDEYLRRVADLLTPDGVFMTNLPAFGADPVFGTVFPLDLPSWRDDDAADRPFADMPVDPQGYPYHGHLVWASAGWWQRRVEAAGLHRLPVLEHALHRRYDDHFLVNAPARRSFFVFAKRADSDRIGRLVEDIDATASAALAIS